MKIVFLSAAIILVLQLPNIKTQHYVYPEVVSNVNERAEILKQQIRDELRESQAAFGKGPQDIDFDRSLEMENDYVYEQPDNGPITPIMKHEKRKDVKHIPKVVETIEPSTTTKKKEVFNLKPLRTNNKKTRQSFLREKRPSEIFYRRELDRNLNYPVQTMHCLDLLTPYLMGELGNGTFKIIGINNRKVLRVVQLLNEKTDTSTKDEIYSLLYQISTMNIRLFQWDERAMKLLYNTIIHERVHTFRTLKGGVKKLLTKWHMDFGDIANLLHQTRIFRPPCIQTSELAGSTRSSRGTRYTKHPDDENHHKKTCVPYNEDDDECL